MRMTGPQLGQSMPIHPVGPCIESMSVLRLAASSPNVPPHLGHGHFARATRRDRSVAHLALSSRTTNATRAASSARQSTIHILSSYHRKRSARRKASCVVVQFGHVHVTGSEELQRIQGPEG